MKDEKHAIQVPVLVEFGQPMRVLSLTVEESDPMTDPVCPVAPREDELRKAIYELESCDWTEAEMFAGESVISRLDVLNAVRNVFAAAPVPCAASPADPWQPIETAPKDGTKILVYTVHGEIELTFWFTVETDRYDDVGDGLYRKREETVAEGWNGNCPTHWMPLPTPPRATGEGAERLQTAADVALVPAHVGAADAGSTLRADAPVAVSLGLPEALAAFIDIYDVVFDEDDVVMLQAVLARLRGEATVRVETDSE